MGEQNREVESREQPPRQPSPVAGHGKELANHGMGPATAERVESFAGVPIRLFPTAYPVQEAYYPLLNAITRAHPETFAHFKPWTPQLGRFS